MKHLTQYITSSYMTAANALQSHSSRRRIIAYVESYDDVYFWRTVLKQLEDDTRYFEIMLPTQRQSGHNMLSRGKKSAMRSIMGNTGQDMIACVDADYDYLIQGMTESSQLMLDTPYVFHTFAYAIENLQCYADSLHDTCVMVTLNDRRIFDFKAYLTNYSIAVWPLFAWSIYLYRHGLFDIMSISDMDKLIYPGKVSMETAGQGISRIHSKVQQKVNNLRSSYPEIAKKIPATRDDLRRLGVTPETVYLYLHGHHLFEKIVLPMMHCVCDRLIKDRETEIHRQSVHRTQMNNELSCYANSLEDITSMMKKNTGYTLSPQYRMITEQIAEKLNTQEKKGN